ncbi:hypothetical protein [Winogradskyella helgolandensis]|uniref:hypothetical protein n=1 Tax=Winogradskyella helgolandensis TaxID=2697010 RepID=UPI0015CBF7B4|nr:hypothetical protein [Winogradskyella helgolandensis]
MIKTEINCLKSFFTEIDKRFKYVVTRNGDELPLVNKSNDIDIMISKKDYKEFDSVMKTVFKSFGFNRLERTSYHGIECYTFYNINEEIPFSIKIDLFFNYEGGGVIYYTYKDLIKYRKKNVNGVYIFENKVESYLTVYKTFAAGGKLKERYLDNFIKNIKDTDFILLKSSPSKNIIELIKYVITNKKNPKIINRNKIVRQTFLKNLIKSPLQAVSRVFYHFSLEIKRAFNKQYFFVFVGPDGSGKTTLINKLKSDSKSIFKSDNERFEICHHRPHLLPNIKNLFKKELNTKEIHDLNFNPHSAKQSSSAVSFIKLLYYITDYLLGYFLKIIKLQRNNRFIIFDRYYFDFIVDQKRSAININKSIAIAMYKLFIPKPNQVFFIKVDAQEAYDRKKELPVQSIEEINQNYENLSTTLKHFDIINNDNLEEAYGNVRISFINKITKKI